MRFPVNRAGASGAWIQAIRIATVFGRSRSGLFAAWAGSLSGSCRYANVAALLKKAAEKPKSVRSAIEQ